MRYAGQSYDLAIEPGAPWTGSLQDDAVDRLVEAFHAQHDRRYAYRSEDETVEIVQLRVSVRGEETAFPVPVPPGESTDAGRGNRDVYFTGVRQTHTASVWNRPLLAPGSVVDGPAVVEGEGSSALIPPGWTATVDRYLNLDVRRNATKSSA
jgi:N-methylhydantoinase A